MSSGLYFSVEPFVLSKGREVMDFLLKVDEKNQNHKKDIIIKIM
jgi:hypothetical protein